MQGVSATAEKPTSSAAASASSAVAAAAAAASTTAVRSEGESPASRAAFSTSAAIVETAGLAPSSTSGLAEVMAALVTEIRKPGACFLGGGNAHSRQTIYLQRMNAEGKTRNFVVSKNNEVSNKLNAVVR